MKMIYSFVLALSISATALAQAPAWMWAKSGRGNYVEGNAQVAIDGSGNVYSAGQFLSPSVAFGTATLTNSNSGEGDIFMVKYSPTGNVLWVLKAGDRDSDGIEAIAVNSSNHIYVAGYFEDTLSFGTNSVVTAGGSDVFVAKFDSMGTNIWLKRVGGTGFDNPFSLALDNAGNIAIGGHFRSPAFVAGNFTLTNATAPKADGFAMVLDPSGTIMWARSMGGNQDDIGRFVTFDASGNVYGAGHFYSDILTIASTTLANTTPSMSNSDAYIVKFSPLGNVLMTITEGGSKSEEFSTVRVSAAGNIVASGWYMSSDLVIGSSTLSAPVPSNADFFLVSYNASGNPQWVMTKAGAVYPSDMELAPNGDIYFVTGGNLHKMDANGSADWTMTRVSGSTENLYSIDLRLPYIAVGGGFENTATLGTTTLSSMGYDDVLTGVLYECTAASVSITQAGLTANIPNATYQWYDCTYGSIVSGENGINFMPHVNSSYAVIVSINGCVDTSACMAYNTTGVKETGGKSARLAPNPASTQITAIDLPSGEYILLNLLGQPVRKITVVSDKAVTTDVSDLSEGVYFLTNQRRSYSEKVVIQR
jgi:hypothetical protein